MRYEEPTWDFLKAGRIGATKAPITLATITGMANLTSSTIDSYSESNQDDVQGMTSIGIARTHVGQTFTVSIPSILTSCKFYLKKNAGSPTGNATAKLYVITGTVGSTAVPTGVALATSDSLDVSTTTGSYVLYTFTFSGVNQVNLSENASYAIVLSYPSGTNSNSLGVGVDSSSPTHSGNKIQSVNAGVSWSASSTIDVCFYLYGIQYFITTYNFGGKLGHWYRTEFTVGGTIGSVSVKYGNGVATTFAAGVGASSYLKQHTTGSGMLSIIPSADFDGTVTSVTITKIT